ncbi:ABC transporter ATP-binding protein [Natronosalvus vescus]|uniref:ABC transporter ATP-binding protein n=1 Tax=Natronosalvus vescus TaxID=2953881 RepID=UPI00209169C7|nr:ABC transporter ATP-binding protein [Natronosalvus vescus]
MARGSDSTAGDETAPPTVRADTITKRYTRGKRPGYVGSLLGRGEPPVVTALEDVSLSVYPGEIVAISGPSGSGKSTLLHHLAGLERPDEGTVTLQGEDLTALSRKQRTRLRLEHVGIVFQHFHLVDSLSARANVGLPLVELGVPAGERKRRATALLERVGLEDRLTHRPGELSGGEQQRVSIARALVTDPALVVADEPTGELDSETGRRVLNEFERIGQERAVVIASHDHETLEIADRNVRLRDGRISAETDVPRDGAAESVAPMERE